MITWTELTKKNKPKIEVLCLNAHGDSIVGYVHFNGSVFDAENHSEILEDITHFSYINKLDEGIDIISLEKERFEWSLKTFPQATSISSLKKLRTEIDEIEYDIQNSERRPEEYADALMCLFDAAGRSHGITPLEIFEAFKAKMKVNKGRKWIKNPDNSYSHVKESDTIFDTGLKQVVDCIKDEIQRKKKDQ